jgi:hypothetical protein
MNPFEGLASFALGLIKDGIWASWLKFLFEMAFSGLVTFLFVCGGVLASTRSWSLSTGLGMTATAISLTVLFRREQAKLTKGMLVVLPGKEAAEELAADVEVIQKSK